MGGKIYKDIIYNLSQEKIQKEVDSIYKIELPKHLQKWVDDYSLRGQRQGFIWKWLYKVNCIWEYSNVDEKYHQQLVEVKLLYNMFIVLLDDIAEKNGEGKLLDLLVKIPKNSEVTHYVKLSKKRADYLLFSIKVWKRILNIIKKFPHFSKLEDLFYYDTNQFINAVLYANLVFKKPYLINEKEFWLYLPHSMQILIDLDLDLMANLKFIPSQVGKAREVVLTLQEMGRIGNWLSTWEREVMDDDFTSIVVAHAINKKLIGIKNLKGDNKLKLVGLIKKSAAEERFLEEWEVRYRRLSQLSSGSRLIKKNEILKKARYLIYMHLISTGLK